MTSVVEAMEVDSYFQGVGVVIRWCPCVVRAKGVEQRFDDVVEALAWKRENIGTAGAVYRERDGRRLTKLPGEHEA
jgi:hypothetical protein